MGIKPIDGFAKKKYGITQTRDVVDPTWEIKQQFNENRTKTSLSMFAELLLSATLKPNPNTFVSSVEIMNMKTAIGLN